MSFKISALPEQEFSHLFKRRSDELASLNAIRMAATHKPGFPCRVSLQDAEIGEEVILLHYQHQAANTPFQASHAIYIRAQAQQAQPAVDEVPEMLQLRTLSLRAFDLQGMMVLADLSEGCRVRQELEKMFLDPAVAYIHIHFAKPGCYAARADRA